MKANYFFLVVLACAALFQPVYPQGALNGLVVEVIDGRTLKVETSPDQFVTVKLRYVETPEPGQPLNDIVARHLAGLALGKKVSVRRIRMFKTHVVGVVTSGEVNISQQMLRDGAGWFDIFDSESQAEDVVGYYKELEAAAKIERRGVWGIPAMKTAWEFRGEAAPAASGITMDAALAKAGGAEEISLAESVKRALNSPRNQSIAEANKKPAIYDFQFPSEKALGGMAGTAQSKASTGQNLNNYFDPKQNKGFVSTQVYEFDLPAGKLRQPMAIMFGYDYTMQEAEVRPGRPGLLVASKLIGRKFLEGKKVSIILDGGKTIDLGKARYISGPKAEAFIFENISLNGLGEFLASENATVVVGQYKRAIEKQYKESVNGFIASLR